MPAGLPIFSLAFLSTSWSSEAAASVPGGAWAARAARAAGQGPAGTTRGPERRDRTKAYDSWGCPGATRGTRGALESPSCCSRTSAPLSVPFLIV